MVLVGIRIGGSLQRIFKYKIMNEQNLLEARQQFGLLFKDLRKKKGLTQKQVSDFCGVTVQTINKVELGKFPYSVDLLMKLSVILDFVISFEMKKVGNPNRFVLKKIENENLYSLSDQDNLIVCIFEPGKFNETQKFSFHSDTQFDVVELATIMREFGDWIVENHPDLA